MGGKLGFASDMWSLGFLLYFLVTKIAPFAFEEGGSELICDWNERVNWKFCNANALSDDFKDLIESLL